MAPSRYSDEQHASAAARSRKRTERLKAEGKCYRCGAELPSGWTPKRCEACGERNSSRNRMRAIRASMTDAERAVKNKADREYYAQKRADERWRARKWTRNAVNGIKRRFNFEGGEEWAEAANQIRLVRRALGRGGRGRPPMREVSLSPNEASTPPSSSKA